MENQQLRPDEGQVQRVCSSKITETAPGTSKTKEVEDVLLDMRNHIIRIKCRTIQEQVKLVYDI